MASTVPSAVIRLPVESILLPVPRTVSDGAGDGSIAALIVVMGTNEAKAFGAKGIAGSRLKPSRKIAAGYRNAHRNGFDSLDAAGIAEPGGKMMRMTSIIWNPYIWYVGTYNEIADAFSYLIANLKTVTAYGMEKSADTRDTDRFDKRCRYGMSSYLRFRLPCLPPRSNGFGFETLAESCHFFSALFSSSWFVSVFLCICIHAANSGSAYVR